MVKNCFLVALLFVAVTAIMAVPMKEEYEPVGQCRAIDTEVLTDEEIKLSCNFGDGVCAMHCISIGRSGGLCKEGVCHCIQKK